MKAIFTMDEFPAAMNSINRRISSLQVVVPSYSSMAYSKKKSMQQDMKELSELIEKMETSLESIEGQQLLYRKWKTQLDKHVSRLGNIVSAFHNEEQTRTQESTEETTGLLQQTAFEVGLKSDLINEQDQHIDRVSSAIRTVNTMIKEFGQLVHEQAAKIDSIELFIESTEQKSQMTLAQLQKTHQKDKTSRHHRLLLCLLVAVALCCSILMTLSLN